MSPRPFTILIVSPDRANLRRLSRFLDAFGYVVRQAVDSQQALAAAGSAHPDFLILDGSGSQPADLALCRAVRRLWPQGYTYGLLLAEKPDVAQITSALEAGFDDFLAAPMVFGELLARLRAGARFIEFEQRLSNQRGIDPCSGLADKSLLLAEWQRRSQTSKGLIGWLAVLDLDYFAGMADRVGRCAARDLIRQVADLVRSRCGKDEFAAALGEDRLAILLPPSGCETAATWCEELLKVVAGAMYSAADQQHRLTASCGLADVTAGETWDASQARALKALSLAKASGRNCVATSDEVDRDAEAWAALAAEGKLFETTAARDVMHACPLLLSRDETLDQAHALLCQTGLSHAPVVDAENKLVGLVSLDQLAAARLRSPGNKPPNGSRGSSVRLVRHVMTTEVTRFEEETPLGELMEHFTVHSDTVAIIVQNKRPRGVVHCQALAALNERLTVEHFATPKPPTATSADLLVPDLAMAE